MAENNFQNSGFSQQQFLAIQQMIQGAVAGAAGTAGPPGPPGPPGPQGTPAPTTHTGAGDKWNAQEIGFFDPFYEEKTVATGGPVASSDKNTYFRNIHMFINRITNMTSVKDDQLLRDNL